MSTLRAFGGWNSGSIYEVDPNKWMSNSNVVSSVDAPAPWLNEYVLNMSDSSVGQIRECNMNLDPLGSADTFLTMGFWARFENLPGTNRNFLRFKDVSKPSNIHCYLSLDSSGNVGLHDSAGVEQATASSAISADTWYWMEIEIEFDDSSGSMELYIDRSSVASASAIDTVTSSYRGAAPHVMSVLAGASSQNFYVGSFYIYSDTTALPDRLNKIWVIPYLDDEAADPDFGDPLDVGDGADLADIPPDGSNFAKYQQAGDSGVFETSYNGGSWKSGPKNDSRVGTIVGGMWFYQYEFNSVFGTQALDFHYGAGDGSDGTSSQVLISSSSSRAGVVVEEGSNVPTKWEFGQYGFGVSGSASPIDIELEEAQFNLLVVPRDNITLGRGLPSGGGEDVLVWTGG